MAVSAFGFYLAIGRAGPIVGGAVVGSAISTMHYIGMAAARVPADAIWDRSYIAASILIGVVIMAVAMRIAIRTPNIRGFLTSAATFTVAICGMHFTGMTAVAYRYNPQIVIPDWELELFRFEITHNRHA
jgi:NO-binding membrane sensor protein with MHYT domain